MNYKFVMELAERDSFTVIVVSLLSFMIVWFLGLYFTKKGQLELKTFKDFVKLLLYFNVVSAFLAQCFYIILESGYV